MRNLLGTLSQHYQSVSSGWILLQIHIGPTQSRVEKKTPVVLVKELFIITYFKLRLPHDVFEFMKNRESKTRVIKIVS